MYVRKYFVLNLNSLFAGAISGDTNAFISVTGQSSFVNNEASAYGGNIPL